MEDGTPEPLDFDVHLQTKGITANSSGQFLVALELLVPESSTRVPVQIVPVIDVSNSMAEHLPLLKDGLVVVVENQQVLSDVDDLALVTFGFTAKKLCSSEGLGKMTGTRRDGIIDCVRKIRTSGMTNLHGGLKLGLEEVRRGDGRFAFILLMTDGIASAGMVQPSEILDDVTRDLEAIEESGCHLGIYTIGFGHEHNSTLLRQIAEVGQGQYTYVEGGDTFELISKIHEWLVMFSQLRATETRISMQPYKMADASKGITVTGMHEITFTRSEDNDGSASPSKPTKRSVVMFGDTFAGTLYRKLISLDVRIGDGVRGHKEMVSLCLSYRDALTDEEHTVSKGIKVWVAPQSKESPPSMAIIPNHLIPRPIAIPHKEVMNIAVRRQLAADIIRNAAICMHSYCTIAKKEIRLTGSADSPTVRRSKAALTTWEQLLETLADIVDRDPELREQRNQLKKMESLRAEGRLEECQAMANNFHQRHSTNTLSKKKSLANLFLNALARQKKKKTVEGEAGPSDAKLAAKLAEKMAAIEAGQANPEIVELEERLAMKRKKSSSDTWKSSELARSLQEFRQRREELLKMAGVSWFGIIPSSELNQVSENDYQGAHGELLAVFQRRGRHNPMNMGKTTHQKITEF
ncbi:uncharacterized protein LOC134186473 [Corticium candelabrum]|uniref:uncharacterized protein LOC134186473 n=1 Tax=Corticium candelabrum TaxID=121492 RepID=UPI002E2693CF|nr:uncharacterized protein LOC134186473 [Corticium candelabrum]